MKKKYDKFVVLLSCIISILYISYWVINYIKEYNTINIEVSDFGQLLYFIMAPHIFMLTLGLLVSILYIFKNLKKFLVISIILYAISTFLIFPIFPILSVLGIVQIVILSSILIVKNIKDKI